ncbi:MAG: hypothetical protein E7318_10555 [Clostridiales bacterium]|nr:hypothetical protein [Clostridiales bacterium]
MKKICAWLLILIMACTMTGVAEEEMNLKYRSLGEDLYRLGDTGYIIEHWRNFIGDDQMIRNISRNAQQYNTYIPLDGTVKKYVYFIESPRCVNMAGDLSGENEIYVKIRDEFETTATGTLALDHYTDYTKRFYVTDHHWNHIGSYKAYCDIIDMMFGPEEEKIVPIEEVVFEDIPFNGSFHSMLGYSRSTELFAVYRFPDFVPYTVKVNGSPAKSYGNGDRYFSGKYQRATVYNHYSGFYGGDRGELILKTNRPEKKTLLLFSNSYSNAVNLLLLQHYDAVYAIDPRFYEKEMGKKFNAQKYIEQNEIDDVLILGDASFFVRTFGLSGR